MARSIRWFTILAAAVLVVVLAAALWWWFASREEPADTRFSGAWRLPDERLMLITPRSGDVLRFRMMDGTSGALWPVADGTFEGGPGFSDREPVTRRVWFETDDDGRASEARWQAGDADPVPLQRLDLPEEIVTFPSGDLALRGKLVTPPGPGPHPVVVTVHGSESYSAVDYYYQPYLYAAHGIAGFTFDKRGTGESEGEYLQNFPVLADDVVAALEYLRGRDDIDRHEMHLAGFSQGGWIAPLAAQRDGGVASVLVAFGVALPVTAEDRWGYVHALREQGFGAAEIAAADRVNALIEAIVDRREDRWSELAETLDEVRDEDWFAAVAGSDSMLGTVAESSMPVWAWRAWAWWRSPGEGEAPFIDRTWDPRPVLEQLDTPSFWILGGADSSAPTPWTVEVLDELIAAGRPIDYHVFPDAEHGILRFETRADGGRRYLGYEPAYLPMQIEWLQDGELSVSPRPVPVR